MAAKYEGSIDISPEEAERIGDMQDQAARDADEGLTMIAIRWGRPQLRMIKRAAELRGVPYQIYIRNAAWELARHDLESAELLMSGSPGVRRPPDR